MKGNNECISLQEGDKIFDLIRMVLTIADLLAIASLLAANAGGIISGDVTVFGSLFAGLILIALNAEIVGAILQAFAEVISAILGAFGL